MVNFDLLSDIDKQVLKESGYGKRRGFGESPALVIIDAQKKFVGPDLPILEASKIYPICIGERANRSVENIYSLLKIARKKHCPVFYSTSGVPVNEMPFNSFAKKRLVHEFSGKIQEDRDEIADMIAPREDEWVVDKRYASAFFGTPLISFLNTLRIDTLLVTGFVTSGCIRAFAVDAASYNFNTVIAEECVADRFETLHDAALLDMHLKYADVLPAAEVLEYLGSIN
jgi:nicotinamidase-related amidase